MHILTADDLKAAEQFLKGSFPMSSKVYGYLFHINRGKAHNLQVIADTWPNFNVIVCKPKQKNSLDREGHFNIHYVYSKNKESFKTLLGNLQVIDWNKCALLEGISTSHLDAVKELCSSKNIPTKTLYAVIVLTLEDPRHLIEPPSNLKCRIAPLTAAHAELVNSKWRVGGDEMSYNSVLSYISNYPSWCVLDKKGQPVSWVLLYQHCAMGLLYTLPEHRGKGYAKMLVSIMSRQLLEQGYPVYCFVEEDNEASFQLFMSLGFQWKSDCREVWIQVNERKN